VGISHEYAASPCSNHSVMVHFASSMVHVIGMGTSNEVDTL